MVEMSVLLEKMLIFLVLMVIGYVLAKKGMLDRNSTRAISSLTINVFMCASIIGSGLGMEKGLSLGELGKLLPEKLLQPLRELEAGDLLMIAVLYLLYRESGDTELLLILGAMLFL